MFLPVILIFLCLFPLMSQGETLRMKYDLKTHSLMALSLIIVSLEAYKTVTVI